MASEVHANDLEGVLTEPCGLSCINIEDRSSGPPPATRGSRLTRTVSQHGLMEPGDAREA
eukprot:5939265-Prymnesium_polylepis.1